MVHRSIPVTKRSPDKIEAWVGLGSKLVIPWRICPISDPTWFVCVRLATDGVGNNRSALGMDVMSLLMGVEPGEAASVIPIYTPLASTASVLSSANRSGLTARNEVACQVPAGLTESDRPMR